MTETAPEDMEITELRKKVQEMASWLDEAFSADCLESEYTDGCASCDAGMAIKHLRLIEKALAPFTPSHLLQGE